VSIAEGRWKASIARRYGGKRGLLRHCVCSFVYFLGGYKLSMHIEWGRVRRIVFVCKGNICRSPYGEARARGLGLPSASCGLDAEKGNPVYPMTLTVSHQRDVDVSLHRSCALSAFSILPGDLFCVMEPWQRESLQRVIHRNDVQITLLGLWSRKPRPHIEDPYGLSAEYFNTCFSIIDDAIQNIAILLKESYAA
jgi:protein-tyrosine phosphatase